MTKPVGVEKYLVGLTREQWKVVEKALDLYATIVEWNNEWNTMPPIMDTALAIQRGLRAF